MDTRKARGYEAEQIVVEDYKSRGYCIIEQNWTMRGGEIDVVVRDEESGTLVFVEVKLVSGMVDDVMGYVTKAKLRHLERSIRTFLVKFPVYNDDEVRVDVVFVDGNGIQERCEGIYLS